MVLSRLPMIDLLITHAAQVATCASPSGPKRGHALADVGLLPPDTAVAIHDGRILALSGRELVIGDGTRWELHTLAAADSAVHSTQVAVADDGQIYTGLPSGIARLEFLSDGHL